MKSSKFEEFWSKHVTSRTYFFQLRKCKDVLCQFHKPLRGEHEVDIFPDPIPTETDGVLHYNEGSDPTEKYLPSTLENVEKQDSGIRFPVTAQTAKNVGFVIHCTECKKPRCLYAQHVLKNQQPVYAKRIIQKVDYVCGASLSEYVGSGGDKDEQLLKVLFVRENLSCSSMIELPYYGVAHYPIVCVHCGVTGTNRTLNTTAENYPKCHNCDEKPDVVRRKRKTLVQTDLGSKRKK